jgi:hypothetical protein
MSVKSQRQRCQVGINYQHGYRVDLLEWLAEASSLFGPDGIRVDRTQGPQSKPRRRDVPLREEIAHVQ